MKIYSFFIWFIQKYCIYLQKIYRNAVNNKLLKNKIMLEVIELETLRKIVGEAVADAISKQPQTDEEPKYLTRSELATQLRVTLVTLWNWQKKGLLIPHKIGNRILYDEAEVNQALATGKLVKYGH